MAGPINPPPPVILPSSTKKSLLFKNKPYDGVRLTIVGSQSGVTNLYYTEAEGNRFYYTFVGATASPDMQAATFNSFMSFTMSGASTFTYNLIPMEPGETVMIDSHVLALNGTSTKGYVSRAFGGFKHTGSALSIIGGSIDYNHKSDFSSSSCKAEFYAIGTQSVGLTVTGNAGEEIDWDVFIEYRKSYHSVQYGPGGDPSYKPIYPQPPEIN